MILHYNYSQQNGTPENETWTRDLPISIGSDQQWSEVNFPSLVCGTTFKWDVPKSNRTARKLSPLPQYYWCEIELSRYSGYICHENQVLLISPTCGSKLVRVTTVTKHRLPQISPLVLHCIMWSYNPGTICDMARGLASWYGVQRSYSLIVVGLDFFLLV